MRGYTTREAAELTGLTPEQIRGYIRHGLLQPERGVHGEYRIDFRDMVLLRTARSLRDAHVPNRRALAGLRSLRSALGDAQSLASLSIQAEGGSVVVREDRALWDAQTGQGHLNFSVRDFAGQVAELRERRFDGGIYVLASEDFYDLGVDLEEIDPARSAEAYRRALELDDCNVDAHVNLGRLMQSQGRRDEAREHYEQALVGAPDHQLARYNLGTVYDEQDDLESAVECYRRASDVADAHYNLCRIYELKGDQVTALRHLRRYQQLCANDAGD